MATQAIPPSQLVELSPKSAELPSHHVEGAAGEAKCPRTVRQVPAKCQPSVRQACGQPVWCGVRNAISSYTLYSSINGYFKKPFSQLRGGKPSSTLLQCQSLPTSSLRAVRSEYPAHIVVVFIYKLGGKLFGLSRCRFILQATSLQRTGNIKNKAGHKNTHGTVSSLFFSR
jgi:hypothetical protein